MTSQRELLWLVFTNHNTIFDIAKIPNDKLK